MEDKETIVIDIQLNEKGVANQLAEVNQQIAAVKAQNAQLRKEVREGTKTWKDVSGQLAVNEQRLKTLGASQKALTGQFNAQVGTNKRLGDSLKEMGAELTALKNEYRSLSEEDRKAAKGQELLKAIQDLDAKMKEADGTMGDFQRNVGNYPDAVKPVTAQLKEMTQALIQLRMEGKANTEEYNELLKKTGEMKDAMMDAQREVKQMASDTGALNSVLDAGKLAAGAFSAALGVMNLVGDKDSDTAKELAEAQRKLQAAIAITTGIQAVQNALQKESALMMGVNKLRIAAAAAAQKLYAAATRDAAAAQGVFNKVAKSNIYVWLAGVILSVVGAIAAFTRGSKEQHEQIEKTNFELKKQLDYLNELNEMYKKLEDAAVTEAEQRLETLKAQGAKSDKIIEAENKALEAKRLSIEAEKERLGYTEQNYNLLKGKYARALDEYNGKVERMNAALREGNTALAATMQDQLAVEKERLDGLAQQVGMFEELRGRMFSYQQEYRTTMKARAEETITTTKKTVTAIKREVESLIEVLTLDQIAEKNKNLADSIQKVVDKVGLLKTSVEQLPTLDLSKYTEGFDNSLDRFEPSALEKFSADYQRYAEQIQETSAAVESSFSSVASMYQTMAQDETKSEEQRAAAAEKAKRWSKMQIAANAGTAIAKGVSSAVDVGFPAAIPAIATMLAAILAAIAQAKSIAQQGYESGGSIGGFHGASMGSDNTVINARKGEMVINAEQQKRLYDIATGSATSTLTSSLVAALSSMPAPVMDYQEFTRFQGRVASINENSKLR